MTASNTDWKRRRGSSPDARNGICRRHANASHSHVRLAASSVERRRCIDVYLHVCTSGAFLACVHVCTRYTTGTGGLFGQHPRTDWNAVGQAPRLLTLDFWSRPTTSPSSLPLPRTTSDTDWIPPSSRNHVSSASKTCIPAVICTSHNPHPMNAPSRLSRIDQRRYITIQYRLPGRDIPFSSVRSNSSSRGRHDTAGQSVATAARRLSRARPYPYSIHTSQLHPPHGYPHNHRHRRRDKGVGFGHSFDRRPSDPSRRHSRRQQPYSI